MRMSPHGPGRSSGGWYPSISKLPVVQFPPNGITDVMPADRTPGTAPIAGSTRSNSATCWAFSE